MNLPVVDLSTGPCRVGPGVILSPFYDDGSPLTEFMWKELWCRGMTPVQVTHEHGVYRILAEIAFVPEGESSVNQ